MILTQISITGETDMKKQILSLALATTVAMGSGLSAEAAPARMPDGTIFDAEYYAQQNPDIAAALGTDAGLLYLHYQNFGKVEGRKPAADGARVVVPIDTENPAGDYKVGSVYGPKLTKKELAEVREAVKVFLSLYDYAAMSDYEKVEVAQDYLAEICEYAPDWRYNRANTAWGALIYGEAQCSGYARAMKALCDAVGVGCYYVHADSNAVNPSHQWNVVCVDGKWYIIDVQGNDTSGSLISFLVSDETFAKTTGASWDRSSVPACPENYDKNRTEPIIDQRNMPRPQDLIDLAAKIASGVAIDESEFPGFGSLNISSEEWNDLFLKMQSDPTAETMVDEEGHTWIRVGNTYISSENYGY